MLQELKQVNGKGFVECQLWAGGFCPLEELSMEDLAKARLKIRFVDAGQEFVKKLCR